MLAWGGLLLWGGSPPPSFEGLSSYCVDGRRGVLHMSAYFQNGAGELVGMCWLGRWAVLGGASLGWIRGGAGVTNEAPSSCRYDDVSVGDCGLKVEKDESGPAAVPEAPFLCRGSGLPSAVKADVLPAPRSGARSGVDCAALRADLGGGDTSGEPRRFRADVGSLDAISLGP